MISLTQQFLQDISGKNTSIIPLVEIYPTNESSPLCYSIISLTHNDNYYYPILLDISSIKKSVNLETNDFKISNAKIKLSNYEYDGKRFSEIFENFSLINSRITISWKSQSGEVITTYDAFIRDIQQTSKQIIIDAEDLGESMLHKDLPLEQLGVNKEIPENYKNAEVPMVYGHVDRSPAVIGTTYESQFDERINQIIADYKPLAKFKEDSKLLGNQVMLGSTLYVSDGSGGFFPIIKNNYNIIDEDTINLNRAGTLQADIVRKIVAWNTSAILFSDIFSVINQFFTDANSFYTVKGFTGDDYVSGSTGQSTSVEILEQNNNLHTKNLSDVTGDLPTPSNSGVIIYGQIDSWGEDGCWINFKLDPLNHNFECKTYIKGEITGNAVNPTDLRRAGWKAWAGDLPEILPNDNDFGDFSNSDKNLSNLYGGGNVYEYEIENFDEIGKFNEISVGIPDHKIFNPVYNEKFNVDLRIRNLFIWQEATITELIKKKYYVDVAGRYSSLHSGITIPEPTTDNGIWTFNLGICSGVTITEEDTPRERIRPEHITGEAWQYHYEDLNNMNQWIVPELDQYIINNEWFFVRGGESTLQMPWIGVLKKYTLLDVIQDPDDDSKLIAFCYLDFYTSEEAINWATENIMITTDDLNNIQEPYSFPETINWYNKIHVEFLSGNPSQGSDPNVPLGLLNYPEEFNPLSTWEEFGALYNTSDLSTYNELGLIKKPSDIMYHIADTELKAGEGSLPVNSTSLLLARQEHQNWCMSHTINSKINSKKYFKKLAESSKLIPIIDSQGLSFVTLPNNPSEMPLITISTDHILSYSFSRTPIDKIYTKIHLNWKKNYSSGKYIGDFSEYNKSEDISTDSDVYFHSEYNAGYYGLNTDHSDSTLTINSDFIRDFTTAQEYRKYLLYYHCNSKLEIDLQLPIKYMAFEVGDFVNFNKEITNDKSKPYGINLTSITKINGQEAFPAFIITAVDINTKKVKLKLQQLHNLSEQPIEEEGVSMGCTDPLANNYNSDALWDDGSCIYQETYDNSVNLYVQENYNLGDPINASMEFNLYDNNGIIHTLDDIENMILSISPVGGNAIWSELATASNYYSINDVGFLSSYFDADTEFKSFIYLLRVGHPTTDEQFIITKEFKVFNPEYIHPVGGCMDETATNYNPNANYDDGSCQYPVPEPFIQINKCSYIYKQTTDNNTLSIRVEKDAEYLTVYRDGNEVSINELTNNLDALNEGIESFNNISTFIKFKMDFDVDMNEFLTGSYPSPLTDFQIEYMYGLETHMENEASDTFYGKLMTPNPISEVTIGGRLFIQFNIYYHDNNNFLEAQQTHPYAFHGLTEIQPSPWFFANTTEQPPFRIPGAENISIGVETIDNNDNPINMWEIMGFYDDNGEDNGDDNGEDNGDDNGNGEQNCEGLGRIKGDVNNDGIINVLDIVSVVNHVLNNNTLEGCNFWCADLGDDGIVNVLDIVALVNLILS